jgi:CPA2 family monovalent cation:H+ antiporter-2
MMEAVVVVSLRRAGGAVVVPEPATRVQTGDTLVLSGRPQDLARAEHTLLNG